MWLLIFSLSYTHKIPYLASDHTLKLDQEIKFQSWKNQLFS